MLFRSHFSDSFDHQIESDNPRSDRESSASLSVRLFPLKVFDKDNYGKGNVWVYELKLLTEKGSVLKLEYDAVNLELLKIKGRLEN